MVISVYTGLVRTSPMTLLRVVFFDILYVPAWSLGIDGAKYLSQSLYRRLPVLIQSISGIWLIVTHFLRL